MPVSGLIFKPAKDRVWQSAITGVNVALPDLGTVIDPDPLDFASIENWPSAPAPFNNLPVLVGGLNDEELEAGEAFNIALTYSGNVRLTGSDRGSVVVHVEKQDDGSSVWNVVDSTTFDAYGGRLQTSTPKGTPTLPRLLLSLEEGDKLRFRAGFRGQPHNLTNFRVTMEALNI